jgi:hypothetical protein
MRCATVLGVTLFMAAVKAPQAAPSPLGAPLPKMDSQRSASSGERW